MTEFLCDREADSSLVKSLLVVPPEVEILAEVLRVIELPKV